MEGFLVIYKDSADRDRPARWEIVEAVRHTIAYPAISLFDADNKMVATWPHMAVKIVQIGAPVFEDRLHDLFEGWTGRGSSPTQRRKSMEWVKTRDEIKKRIRGQ